MPRLPSVNARKIFRALKNAGFALDRIEGSHYIFWRERDARIVSVPFHGGKTLGKGLIHGILKDAGLTQEEFLKLLR